MRLETAPAVVTRTLRSSEIAATECRADDPPYGELSDPPPVEDAYLIGLQFRDYPEHHYWEDGTKAPVSALRRGETCLYDLRRRPSFLINNPFHSLHFYLPRGALDAIADEANARRIDALDYVPGRGCDDPTLRNLGEAMLAALQQPEQASRLFVDHLALAVAAHAAQTYGGMRPLTRPAKGGLATWQERRAKEQLSANLDGKIVLRDLASECGLSVSHFSHAFRESTGMAPHRWLLRRRVDAAKEMMEDRARSLAEIATACGFADQSHFTRTFSQTVGVSPGTWRRHIALEAAPPAPEHEFAD